MSYRIEHDSMGEVRVPSDKYWAAQTERSRNNFPVLIGRRTLSGKFIVDVSRPGNRTRVLSRSPSRRLNRELAADPHAFHQKHMKQKGVRV